MADTAPKRSNTTLYIIGAIAVIGWFLAFYLMATRSQIEGRFERDLTRAEEQRLVLVDEIATRDEEQGTIETLTTQRTDLETAIADLEIRQGEIDAELAPAAEEFARLQEQSTALDADLSTRQQERDSLEAELAPLREELVNFQTNLDETESAIVTRAEELAEVGQRLEEARASEAALQEQIAALSDDAARLSSEAAEAEARVQEARESEAQLEEDLAAARQETQTLENRQSALDDSVSTLDVRRATLLSDVSSAETQREELQSILAELSQNVAQRSERLAAIEGRIAEAQGTTGRLGRAAAQGLEPGQYTVGPITATFAPDGLFQMSSANGMRNVTGSYALDDQSLRLTNVEGNTGRASFPMTCAIAPASDGFSLTDEDGSCATFDGQSFTRAE